MSTDLAKHIASYHKGTPAFANCWFINSFSFHHRYRDVTRRRAASRHPEAHVVRVLGPAGDIDAEMAALLAEYRIPSAGFSPGALGELPREGSAWKAGSGGEGGDLFVRHSFTLRLLVLRLN